MSDHLCGGLDANAFGIDASGMGDLSPEALEDVLGDADFFLTSHGFELDAVPSAAKLARKVLQTDPEFVEMRHEAYTTPVHGLDRIFIRKGTPLVRARWLVLHELAEVHYKRVGYFDDDVEARCNAMASAMAAPRIAVRNATKQYGHAVTDLAAALKTPQAATVLRIAEVIGRPCALLRDAGPIIRGDWFDWPQDIAGFRRLLKEKRADVHPFKITDERASRFAFMALAA